MSIKVEHLKKNYGSQCVLNDVSFEIKRGEIVGFLGNNGAGKSTTMKIITGYRSYNGGRVEVCGMDIATHPMETRRKTGYLPEHNPLYLDMYVREYLLFVAQIYKVANARQRVDEMIEATGLAKECRKQIGTLSKGYRQRVGLAQALIHDPEVLILDEPTTGLDPNQIVEVRDLIKKVGQQKAVMLSTHIMQEVSAICDRVIILNNGKIVADDKESAILLQRSDTGEAVTVFAEFGNAVDSTQAAEWLRQQLPGKNVEVRCVEGNACLFSADEDVSAQVFQYAVATGNTIKTLRRQERSMEDVFRELTGHA